MAKTAKQVSSDIFAVLDGVEPAIAIEGMASAISFIFVNIWGDIALEGFDALVEDMRNNIEMNLRDRR